MSRRRTGRETTNKAKVCEEAASVDSINVCLCRVFRRTDDVHSEVSTPEQQRLHEPREMWSKTDREYYGDQNEEAGSIFSAFFSFFGPCPNTYFTVPSPAASTLS